MKNSDYKGLALVLFALSWSQLSLDLPAARGNTIKSKFETLTSAWDEHCHKVAFSSSMHSYLDSPQYKALVDLGPAVIPQIIEHYNSDDLPWGFVLQEITGVNMIADANQFSPASVKRNWLSWYETLSPSSVACLKAGQAAPLRLEGANKKAYQVYHVALKTPIIAMPFGNQHISDLRANDKALDVLLAWDMPSGQFSRAVVPWSDIAAAKVSYGLAEHYDPTGLPRHYSTAPEPFNDPMQNAYKSTYRMNASSISKEEAGKTKWEIKLPPGHKVIAFTVHNNLLYIATNSDRGFRDGELATHFLTTCVYITFCPRHGGQL